MRTSRLLLIALVVVTSTSLTGATDAAERLRGPFLLVTLPSLGTVTWTCDRPSRYGSFALGFSALPRFADTLVELRSLGRRVVRRSVLPGQRIRFPFVRARRQTMRFVQGTGAGTLTASLLVEFVPGVPVLYCQPYAPPALTVRVTPRQ